MLFASVLACALLCSGDWPTGSAVDPVEEVIWVYFADKPDVEADQIAPMVAPEFHPRAIQRRRRHRPSASGLFDERDLPIRPEYVNAVAALGAIRTSSRWLNAVSIAVTPPQRDRIETLPFVVDVQPVRRVQRAAQDRPTSVAVVERTTEQPTDFYGLASPQLNQINVVALHNEGYTGADVVIGVLDTGFRRTHRAFTDPNHPINVLAEYDFVNDDPNTAPESGDPSNQHEHGTLILGTLAAYWPDNLVGAAFDASYVLAKVEDVTSEYRLEEDWFVAGLEFIERQGADIATSSLTIYDHYTQQELDGLHSVMTLGFNIAAANGLHCFQGAGNFGHDADPTTSHLIPPADAFQVLSVGAVDVNGNIAGFSSDGPTADGRIKPEILTRGANTYTVDPFSDQRLVTASGTSLATPLAAGAAACVAQAHTDWTVGQMRAALTRTAGYYRANGTHDPLFVLGYGIIDAAAASGASPTCLQLSADELVAGESAVIAVQGAQPLSRIVVLWSTSGGTFRRSTGGWCVNFALQVPGGSLGSRIVATGRTDRAGAWSDAVPVPAFARGAEVLLQAAQHETCPASCMSEVVERTIR